MTRMLRVKRRKIRSSVKRDRVLTAKRRAMTRLSLEVVMRLCCYEAMLRV